MRAFAVALLTLLSTLAAGDLHAQTYVARDLGKLWWGGQTVGYGLNSSGQVAGASLTFSGWRGFITGANGVGMTELGTLGGQQSFAMAVNDSGQAVGFADTSEGRTRAFITGPDGRSLVNLGTLGVTDSFARGINGQGQVVGYAGTRAFVTGPNGAGLTDLSPQSYRIGQAFGINDRGQVAGFVVTTPGGPEQAFITGPSGLNILGLTQPADGRGFSLALNASVQTAVTVHTLAGDTQAFITRPAGDGLSALAGLGGNVTAALGLNSRGEVVGYSFLASGGPARAFVTGANGVGMVDLNTLVSLDNILLSEARAINDAGQIVANATNGRAYLLTPVPEPGHGLLLLAGLCLLAVVARRRTEPQSGA